MTTGLIVALDTPDLPQAEMLARSLAGKVAAFKVGSTLFAAHGPEALLEVGQHGQVFCDLKIHDIPHQVEQTVRELVRRGVWMVTVHASGGRAMVEAAVRGAADEPCVVAAVTVLTSLGAEDLPGTETPEARVMALARLAVGAGAGAVVCSAAEAAAVRREFDGEVLVVVPGIRPKGSESADQARVATPAAAAAAGADYIVVGRPIAEAQRPESAVREILEELGS